MSDMKRQRTPSQRYLDTVEKIKDNLTSSVGSLENAYESGSFHFDSSPDSLKTLTKHNYPDLVRDEGTPPFTKTMETMSYIQEGAVLGDVIKHNLGGEWAYPSYARMLLYDILRDIGIPFSLAGRTIFPKMEIKLNDKVIPVMKIARFRVKWNDRVFSIEKAYEEIRKTGEWSGKVPLTDMEKRILKEKRQMWRIERWSWLYDPRNRNSRTLNHFIRNIMFEREYIRTGEMSGGGDYSPGGLRKIDEFFSKKNLMDRMRAPEAEKELRGELGKKNFFHHICRGVGGYLGETIVRHLGGQWIYPTHIDFVEAQKRHKYEYLQERCAVRLQNITIPVMTIAQLRLEGKIPSLLRVYEEIKHTGRWSGNPPMNP